MFELKKEMWDDKDADAGAFKSKNRDKTRLAQFIRIALAQQGVARKTLLEFYPELNAERKRASGWLSLRRAYLRSTLKPLAKAYGSEIDE